MSTYLTSLESGGTIGTQDSGEMVSGHEAALTSAKAEIASLTAALATAKAEVASLTAQLAAAAPEIDSLTAKLAAVSLETAKQLKLEAEEEEKRAQAQREKTARLRAARTALASLHAECAPSIRTLAQASTKADFNIEDAKHKTHLQYLDFLLDCLERNAFAIVPEFKSEVELMLQVVSGAKNARFRFPAAEADRAAKLLERFGEAHWDGTKEST